MTATPFTPEEEAELRLGTARLGDRGPTYIARFLATLDAARAAGESLRGQLADALVLVAREASARAGLEQSRVALEAGNDELRRSNEELSRRAQAAEVQAAEFKRIGQQVEADSRKFFDQSCANQRERDEVKRQRDELRAATAKLAHRVGCLDMAYGSGKGMSCLVETPLDLCEACVVFAALERPKEGK